MDSKKTIRLKVLEVTALVIALAVIVGLFSLPIIFYYITESSSSLDDLSNISIVLDTNSTALKCTDLHFTWSKPNTTFPYCNNYPYMGTKCMDFLNTWHLCTVGDRDIYVNETKHIQNQREKDLALLDTVLVYHKDCRQMVLPFLCQYYFPLHDCPNGDIYTASREDCIDISTGICASLWNLAINYGYGNRLPDCQELPSYSSQFMDSYPQNDSSLNQLTNLSLINITCKEDFIEINNTCLPRCDKFELTTHSGALLLIYSELIASCLALLICILIVILSIKNYKTMFTYPSVLILFQVVDCAVIAILVIIVSIDRNGLLCSSTSLSDSVNNPTPFCTLSGALLHYCIVNLVLWWFLHVIIFFHKVAFPFHANRMKKMGQNKYVLAAVIIIALAVPLPAVIISLSVEEYHYKQYRFPPFLCVSKERMWFYSNVAIIDVLVATGTCLMIVVFWIIHTRSVFSKNLKKKKAQLSTAEKKIIVALCSFILFAVFTLAQISDYLAKKGDLLQALSNYFKCEALGHIPGKCNRSQFEHYYNPFLNAITYTLMGLIPLGILNFVLKWKSVKKVTKKVFSIFNRKSTVNTAQAISSRNHSTLSTTASSTNVIQMDTL